MEATPTLSAAASHDWVALIPRDPDWGLALWEVTAEGLSRCLHSLERFDRGATLVLRLYLRDGGGGRTRGGQARGTQTQEYEITEWLGGRLLLLGRPGATHEAALGLRAPSGAFVPLCRSRPMQSPRSTPASQTVEKWVRVTRGLIEGGPLEVTQAPDSAGPSDAGKGRAEGEPAWLPPVLTSDMGGAASHE